MFNSLHNNTLGKYITQKVKKKMWLLYLLLYMLYWIAKNFVFFMKLKPGHSDLKQKVSDSVLLSSWLKPHARHGNYTWFNYICNGRACVCMCKAGNYTAVGQSELHGKALSWKKKSGIISWYLESFLAILILYIWTGIQDLIFHVIPVTLVHISKSSNHSFKH